MRTISTLRLNEARQKALGLRELRYFLTVAQTGNLGRAARELNVSQPAISLQLRKLEEGLGTQLLHRHARGVTLTPAGVCLRDRLHTVMQLLAAPLEDPAAEPTPRSVSFAVPAEVGAPFVAQLARAFRARWPEVTLDVREASGTDLEAWLLHRHVDLAMLQDTPSAPEIDMTPMFSESLGLVTSAQAAAADGTDAVSLRELPRDSLILPAPQHWIRRRLDRAAQQYGLVLKPVLQVDSTTLTKAMVRGGLGHAVLPLSAVQEEFGRGALGFRPIVQPPLTCTRVMAFHRAAAKTLVAAFASMACDAMAAAAQDGAWPHARFIRPDVRRLPPQHDRPPMQGSGETATVA